MAMGSAGKGPQADINVTPLVDIVLVLLIIFMVITPMLQEGPELDLPKVQNAESKSDEEEELLISVTKEGEYYLGEDLRALDLLEAELSTEMMVNPFKPISIKADVETPYLAVKLVMLACENVGAKSVSLRSDKDSKTIDELNDEKKGG
ncbi:MAG: biopolymer transporter ExbD [Deltaproteobacteria bacterium]|nr:biopolymer transporter ExbD [Deltaproteobacteria bacterium]